MLGPSLVDLYEEGPSALGLALRRDASAVVAQQRAIVEAGAELVLAPTASTTAPALHATGQAYRAAALTALAIDLTRDAVLAAGGRALCLGELPQLPGRRSEMHLHLERLATSGADGLLLTGDDPDALRDLAARALQHLLPVLVELPPHMADLASSLGASAVVFRDADPESLARAIDAVRSFAPTLPLGARIELELPADDRERAQLAVARAWSLLAPRAITLVGVSGPTALAALPALAELETGPTLSASAEPCSSPRP